VRRQSVQDGGVGVSGTGVGRRAGAAVATEAAIRNSPHDLLIGIVVAALAIEISLVASGVPALIYGGWLIVCGMIIFGLLRKGRKWSTVLATVLLPGLLLLKFLPKRLRRQIEAMKAAPGNDA
jgi:hypothetical protein